MNDQTIVLRAQEIINTADKPITARQAVVQALLDRYQTIEEMAQAAASFASGVARKLARSTYELPEQNGLFDIPSTISNSTPDGVLLIQRDQATIGQARQWIKEARQHHKTQTLRFERADEDLSLVSDVDDDVLWAEARRQLGARKHVEIEQ